MTRIFIAALTCAFALPLVARAQDDDDDYAERAERLRDLVEREAVGTVRRSKRDRTREVADQDRVAAEKIVRALDNRKLTVNFEGATFEDVLEFLRDVSGLNVVVSKKAHQKLEEAEKPPVINLKLKDVKLRSVLELLLEQTGDELCYGVRHGVLYLGLAEEWKQELVLDFIPVDDILHRPKDFPGPRVGLNDKGVTWKD